MRKLSAFLLLFMQALVSNAQTIPTWAENVACIFYTRCTSCHHTGGIAPFPLVDYADASGAAAGILDAVQNNRMPPWPPDPQYRRFAHERTLSAQEKQLIIDWVSNGVPLGNPANAPAPPVYSGTTQITNPDLTVSMPVYIIPPISQDLYRNFAVASGTQVDQYITGFEVVPGNRQVVHHVLVYMDTTGNASALDSLDPDPGYSGGLGNNNAKLLGVWVPGSQPDFFPQGMGIRLKAGATIVFQMHYPVGSSFQSDSTQIRFLLSPNPNLREVTVAPILNHGFTLTNGPLFIPADSVRSFHAQLTSPLQISVLGIAPHMHLIGTSIESYFVSPLNDTVPLIRIPKWDFKWQGTYTYRQPLRIPLLSVLHANATYDNTSNNPYNPSIPPQDVSLGEATTDEMMLVYFYFTPYQQGDELIVVDTSTNISTYNGCNFITGVSEGFKELPLKFYPNPASSSVIIDLPSGNCSVLMMTDARGKIVFRKENIRGDLELNVQDYPPGIYDVMAYMDQGLIRSRLVISR